jgi:hypothetical protein
MFVIDSIGLSVSVLTVITLFFCFKIWKYKYFRRWLVKVPDLNGKWSGTIESDWINPTTGCVPEPIPTELIIKQSLFKISCVMKTNEMMSRSISCDFRIDKGNQIFQLSYIYESVPKQNIQERSPLHQGTMIFDFDDCKDVNELIGNYWTGRKTCGHVIVKKV